jgi:peptide chain release factor 3
LQEKKEINRHLLSRIFVGLHDTGNFKIGDTLTEGEIMSLKGIPVSLRTFQISTMPTL